MASASSSTSWTCRACNCVNGVAAYAAFCHVCGAARPSLSSPAAVVDLLSPPSPAHAEEPAAAPSPPRPAEKKKEEEERRCSNPFSSFVYDYEDSSDASGEGSRAPRAPPVPRPMTLKRPLAHPAEKEKKPAKKACSSAMEDMSVVTEEEKEGTVQKWTKIMFPVRRTQAEGLANDADDQDDAVNTYRFRLLVAVILSSRTQARVVREAIEKIAQAFPGQQFSVKGFAALKSWEALSDRLSFVHMNKVKSRHICESAVLIRKEFGGRVPTQRAGLLRMAGIGPTLAPLLEFLYTHDDEERKGKAQEQKTQKPLPLCKAEEDDDEIVILED